MPTLSSDEVTALMGAIQDGKVSPDPASQRPAVVPYDLTSQYRVNRGQMPTLDQINEQVASMLAMGLAGRTRLQLKVTSSPASLLKFADVNPMLAAPATVCVLSLGNGNGQAIVVLDPGLADALLAAAFGDRKNRSEEQPSDTRRDFTSVERQVLKRLLTILTDAMATAWAPVLPFHPEVLRFETDPRLAAIAPPNEAAILSSFEVTGAFKGRLQLAIPYSAVEPAKKLLSSPPRMNASGDTRFATALANELGKVEVELRVILGTTKLSFERLLALDAGEVLTLGTSEESPLPVFVEGRLKLMGQARVSGGTMALVVTQGPSAEIRQTGEQDPAVPTAA